MWMVWRKQVKTKWAKFLKWSIWSWWKVENFEVYNLSYAIYCAYDDHWNILYYIYITLILQWLFGWFSICCSDLTVCGYFIYLFFFNYCFSNDVFKIHINFLLATTRWFNLWYLLLFCLICFHFSKILHENSCIRIDFLVIEYFYKQIFYNFFFSWKY